MLKTKLPFAPELRFIPAPPQHRFEYCPIELPGPVLIGVTQRRRFRTLFDSQMQQLAFHCCQPAADLSLALGMTQLAIQHRHELLPAAETARMPLPVVLFYGGFKLQPREKLQNLTEDAAYSSHGRGLLLPL